MSIFVASPVEIYEGAEAERRLAETNDRRFAVDGNILAVDQARWIQAQQYERETWLTYNRGAVTDRNELHTKPFADYQALPENLGDCLEIACGPFTTVRYVLAHHTVNTLTLLDPLILEYEKDHPNCAYKGWQMGGYPVTPVASAFEDWQPDQTFDTMIATNTVSHCYDASAFFANAKRLLRPGGWLVFAEDVRPGTPDDLYDVGHPLNLRQPVIDEFLSGFIQMYRSGNYFIGRKPGEPITVALRDAEDQLAATVQFPAQDFETAKPTGKPKTKKARK